MSLATLSSALPVFSIGYLIILNAYYDRGSGLYIGEFNTYNSYHEKYNVRYELKIEYISEGLRKKYIGRKGVRPEFRTYVIDSLVLFKIKFKFLNDFGIS